MQLRNLSKYSTGPFRTAKVLCCYSSPRYLMRIIRYFRQIFNHSRLPWTKGGGAVMWTALKVSQLSTKVNNYFRKWIRLGFSNRWERGWGSQILPAFIRGKKQEQKPRCDSSVGPFPFPWVYWDVWEHLPFLSSLWHIPSKGCTRFIATTQKEINSEFCVVKLGGVQVQLNLL
jgi:hypothetical protein